MLWLSQDRQQGFQIKIGMKLKGYEVVFLISTANGAETHALNVPVNTFEIIKKM